MSAGCQCAPDVVRGTEDRFFYEISDSCISCGACSRVCPTKAVTMGADHYEIDPKLCIDCGTCSAVCPVGAAASPKTVRESISVSDIDLSKCYVHPGCSPNTYRPQLAGQMKEILEKHLGAELKLHDICCHNDPQVEEGAVIINNCAGCDRRYRSLFRGVDTISFWEVLDSFDDLELPDHSGLKVSIHDSCSFRHKPQVHRAVRSLLRKMNIEIEECRFSGMDSICCGDNLYGHVDNDAVRRRIKMRAEQFPCENVVVYCIGCVRSLTEGGKKPLYLPDLVFGLETPPMEVSLEYYHSDLEEYIACH